MNDSLAAFLSPTRKTPCRAKVCGFLRPEEAWHCHEAGVDAVGFNFWPKSKRYLSPTALKPFLAEAPPGLARIGVFVNASLEEMERCLGEGWIHAAQLHGDESPERGARLRRAGHVVFKAIGVRDEASLEALDAFDVDAFVLDAFCPGAYGGSGKVFDWDLALKAKERRADVPLVLSGGLTPENVAMAVRQTRPHAVDVASGVEDAPGRKSLGRVRAFLEAVRSGQS